MSNKKRTLVTIEEILDDTQMDEIGETLAMRTGFRNETSYEKLNCIFISGKIDRSAIEDAIGEKVTIVSVDYC